MNAIEHITRWQQLFTATSEKNLFLFSFALLAFFLAALLSITARIDDKPPFERLRNYLCQHKLEIKFFNHLLAAFSEGILHPRVYA